MITDTSAPLRPPRDITAPPWAMWAVVGLMVAPALVKTAADPDLWGHVRFGLDVLATRAIPSVDPYSFTQDVPWIDHEWLSELFMGVAFRTAGPAGVSILKGVLAGVFLLVVLRPYKSAAAFPFGAAVVVLVAGTVRQVLSFRPQIWSVIGIAVLCRLFIKAPRRSWLVGVPLLFLLWANLHGGWIVGAGLVAVWSAFQIVRPEAGRGLVVGVAGLSALATLVNPYGWNMWLFLARTVRPTRAITEWQPLIAAPLLVQITWTAVLLTVLVLVTTKPRLRADRAVMVCLLAYGGFRVQRVTPLCVVAALVLMSPIIVERWPARVRRFAPLSRREARGLALAAVVVALISGAAVLKAASCIVVSGDWIPDGVAGRALTATDTSGRIVTYFAWGEYAIWHLAPRLRVSIDGRRETVYSEATLARHDALEAATPEGIAYLQQLDPIYVWEPARLTTLRDWLAAHGYRIDVLTNRSFVAVRADQPVLRPFAGHVAACYPDP